MTYKDEKGESHTLNLVDLIGNAESLTSLVYNTTANSLTYKDENGLATVINLNSSVAGEPETITTLANNGNGTYTYTSENNTVTTIDVAGEVVNHATTILTNPTYLTELTNVIKNNETLTKLVYDPSGNTLTYTDEKNMSNTINLLDLVDKAETLTKLEINEEAGTLDYKDEKEVVHTLDLGAVIKEPWNSSTTHVGATSNTENIYTQGWVGIGFKKPSDASNEMLRVNGAISTVNTYYADYVFEDYYEGFSEIKETYKFKKLAEVDEYIKTNKHLPGITPINELEKTNEGYSFNVSELSIQLLEKTEELYLHIIEQDKELAAKNKAVELLQEATKSMSIRLEKLEKLMLEKK
ncbi:hypothetical protein [Flavobacterium sp. '19STA2R22 D10 B1']|uniref:hypothetical protein n=1 Tax=Flavobacterium aerium TaxID=3037261 RepID=UPI00278C7AA2|nr:hypothetical protein [Flavobacterium sp. '19STA2R22 D10 B1']